MATFDLALSCVRSGSDDLLIPACIDQLARINHIEFRNTTLTPGNTLRLFVQQVAHGNIACAAVRHLAGEAFTDSAWCQARQRLSLDIIKQVHRALVDAARRELDVTNDLGDEPYRWRTHRLFAMDGTSDSMPDTKELQRPLWRAFGMPSGAGLSDFPSDDADGPPQWAAYRLHRFALDHQRRVANAAVACPPEPWRCGVGRRGIFRLWAFGPANTGESACRHAGSSSADHRLFTGSAVCPPPQRHTTPTYRQGTYAHHQDLGAGRSVGRVFQIR